MNFVIQNDDLCIQNDEICIQNDDLCIQNDELCIQNDELCIQNDELCIQIDRMFLQKMNFVLKWWILCYRLGSSYSDLIVNVDPSGSGPISGPPM